MRLAALVLTTLILLGCSGGSHAPSAPSSSATLEGPPQQQDVFVFAVVADASGICIVGATVEVVAGQAVGRRATQTEPCDVWSDSVVSFSHLRPGVAMTLRASASGYLPQEKVVVPADGPQSAVEFILKMSSS
jgi:hypothetical protein